MKFRLFLIISFFSLLNATLFFKLYDLQIEKKEYYAKKAASQHRLAGFLEPQRGNIYFTDRNNNLIPAAMNKAYQVIFSVPKEIQDPALTAASLASAAALDKEKLVKMFSKPDDEYELFLRKASLSQLEKIRELNLKGIYADEENLRFYPFKNQASHLLGFVGIDHENSYPAGKYGLEFYYDEKLKGEAGRLETNRIIDPISGENLYLTIDSNIQIRAEEILFNLIQKYKAERGMVIVQEPKTGKILAMGVYPNFDPNNYADYKVENFLNPALQSVFEPGSVMKVVTMSAGIDAKKFTPETTVYDSGSLTLDSRTIKNWDNKAHGKVTMTEVIEQSINIGAAQAAKIIGKDLFYNYLVKFGFGEKTGIGLPGEVVGSLGNLKSSFRDINFATAAFGQGVAVTPIQMINSFSAIANGGVLMRPYLNADEGSKVIRRVISEEAARAVTKMMISAVKKAAIAQIPKFDIAGKTGTAQIPDLKRGGYLEEFIHTYIGFAPAFDPKFTILIRIDKPVGAPLAGLTVVPAFRELSEFILNYYNVPPDYNE
ncbi:MAG: penicillin-binding protein 2 [Candidatus Harrisonbacteria bacterium]|nr:penicillin-binding protein 2 [Candidatus Harrisonbacteria bacterium]